MENSEISWKFEVTEKVNPMKIFKFVGITIFSLILFPCVLTMVNYRGEYQAGSLPLWLAILIIVVSTALFPWALKFYFRINTVTISERGLTYWRKEPILWEKMSSISLSFEQSLPHLTLNNIWKAGESVHIPLYLNDIDLFKKKLIDLTPSNHPIRELYLDLDIATKQYTKSR